MSFISGAEASVLLFFIYHDIFYRFFELPYYAVGLLNQ